MTDDDEDINNEFAEDSSISEQPTVDAASRQSLRKRERRIDKERREREQFWRGIFSTEIGRREMYDLLRAAGAFEEKFACGPNGFPQPEATWFHAGSHAFGQRLFNSWAILDRAGVFMMLDENDSRFARSKAPEPKKGDA